jgi:hypothetical protein
VLKLAPDHRFEFSYLFYLGIGFFFSQYQSTGTDWLPHGCYNWLLIESIITVKNASASYRNGGLLTLNQATLSDP